MLQSKEIDRQLERSQQYMFNPYYLASNKRKFGKKAFSQDTIVDEWDFSGRWGVTDGQTSSVIAGFPSLIKGGQELTQMSAALQPVKDVGFIDLPEKSFDSVNLTDVRSFFIDCEYVNNNVSQKIIDCRPTLANAVVDSVTVGSDISRFLFDGVSQSRLDDISGSGRGIVYIELSVNFTGAVNFFQNFVDGNQFNGKSWRIRSYSTIKTDNEISQISLDMRR